MEPRLDVIMDWDKSNRRNPVDIIVYKSKLKKIMKKTRVSTIVVVFYFSNLPRL